MKDVLKIGRRQFLRGAGGFTLALPFLPSLMPKAYAQQGAMPKSFVAFATNHGAVQTSAMYPNNQNMQNHDIYSGMRIRSKNLSLSVQEGTASLSTVLSAPDNELTPALAAKMNVMRGIDIPFEIAHHSGGHLGNNAANQANSVAAENAQSRPMPTIDQLMAWSPNFYSSLSGITRRAIHVNSYFALAFNWSNPENRTGSIQQVGRDDDIGLQRLFDAVFQPSDGGGGGTPPPTRPLVVDRVIENYRSLRDSNKRMSYEDRQRLEDHLTRLAELQRAITPEIGPSTSVEACNNASFSGGGGDPISLHRSINDVIAAAITCGTSRIAVCTVNESSFVPYSGDWHQDVAHQANSSTNQARLQEANRSAFRYAFLDLARKLDVDAGDGTTVLDNTLIQWTSESGPETHYPIDSHVITAGSAGGSLNTGQYCDFRNANANHGHGMLYDQWLVTVMRIMGLQDSEWQNVPNRIGKGYGNYVDQGYYRPKYVDPIFDNADTNMPLVT